MCYFKVNWENVCLTDCATLGTVDLIESFGRENIILLNGTRFYTNDVLYYSKSKRNLPNFKDSHRNWCYIETINEGNAKYLYITFLISSLNHIIEELLTISSMLYHITIRSIQSICYHELDVQ